MSNYRFYEVLLLHPVSLNEVDFIVYIGKEANNIDEQVLDVKKAQEFINENAVYDFILNLTPERAREIGIKHRSCFGLFEEKNEGKRVEF